MLARSTPMAVVIASSAASWTCARSVGAADPVRQPVEGLQAAHGRAQRLVRALLLGAVARDLGRADHPAGGVADGETVSETGISRPLLCTRIVSKCSVRSPRLSRARISPLLVQALARDDHRDRPADRLPAV